jgi:hypothetical protein
MCILNIVAIPMIERNASIVVFLIDILYYFHIHSISTHLL